MKGVLFSVVEDVVIDAFGEDMWDDVLVRAGSDGAYTSLGDYPDTDLVAIVQAIADVSGQSIAQVLVLAGQRGFGVLARRHPYVMNDMCSWRDVLGHLDDIIHPEVRKLYPGADAPQFAVTTIEGGLLLEYRSARRLCHLAEGLAKGTGDWFGTPLNVHHVSCVQSGDETCVLSVVE